MTDEDFVGTLDQFTDYYDLEITSVRPEPDRSCMRPFIRDFDD